jgi:hypothetical protein
MPRTTAHGTRLTVSPLTSAPTENVCAIPAPRDHLTLPRHRPTGNGPLHKQGFEIHHPHQSTGTVELFSDPEKSHGFFEANHEIARAEESLKLFQKNNSRMEAGFLTVLDSWVKDRRTSRNGQAMPAVLFRRFLMPTTLSP